MKKWSKIKEAGGRREARREAKWVKKSDREAGGLYISDKGGVRHDPCVSPC